MPSHSCKQCGTTFYNPSSKRQYCSRKCYFAWAAANRPPSSARVMMVCEFCGEDFESYRSKDRRFCSPACASNGFTGRHGESKTRLHGIWCNMKNRCCCETSPSYQYYGGRGIAIVDEWRDSYEAFRDWAIANGYSDTLELDRRNVNGGYSPDNCRWATRLQQMANTRKRCDGNSSRYKGVSWNNLNKNWRAQICRDGSGNSNIGSYETAIEAALAYDSEAHRLRGEYAFLNFPERFKHTEVPLVSRDS